ncbi:hypothetical protein D3C87_1620870 [compost metagenome]
MFRNQIGRERQQEQQNDLRRRLIAAPATEEAQRTAIQPADGKTGQDAANRHFEELNGRTADSENHGAHRHGDSKLERHQARGVIH